MIAAVNISENSCSTLNTFVNSAHQDISFEEIALYESARGSTVFATILETDVIGYNGLACDFQMIVPAVGSSGWSGATAYYLYVEIS